MSHSSRNAVDQRHEAEVHMELLRAKLRPASCAIRVVGSILTRLTSAKAPQRSTFLCSLAAAHRLDEAIETRRVVTWRLRGYSTAE